MKLPPKMGSLSVPEALTRQVLPGSVSGRKTVKPRFGSICDQSVNVVGLELAEAVAVAVVPPGVRVTEACSSRKTINGLLHQRSLARAMSDEVTCAVGTGVLLPAPAFKPEHDTRVKLDTSKQRDRHSHTHRHRATNEKY